MPVPDFQHQGACGDADPDLFIPEGNASLAAKAVCNGCPVKAPCLEHAVNTGAVGIWGGTTDAERTTKRGRR